jgi:iron uptake system EfeUOB component EfeO/EfeM
LLEWISDYDDQPWVNCAEKVAKFRQKQPKEFADKITSAMETINEILEKYRFELLFTLHTYMCQNLKMNLILLMGP